MNRALHYIVLSAALVAGLSLSATAAAYAAPSAELGAQAASEPKREVKDSADCTTWLESSTGSFDPSQSFKTRVAMRCDRIAAYARVRGVLDIAWTTDLQTPWIQSDMLGGTVRSGWYSGNQSTKSRVEFAQVTDAVREEKTDLYHCVTVLNTRKPLLVTEYRAAISCSYIAPGVMVRGVLDAINQTNFKTEYLTSEKLNTTAHSNWLSLAGVNIRETRVETDQ